MDKKVPSGWRTATLVLLFIMLLSTCVNVENESFLYSDVEVLTRAAEIQNEDVHPQVEIIIATVTPPVATLPAADSAIVVFSTIQEGLEAAEVYGEKFITLRCDGYEWQTTLTILAAEKQGENPLGMPKAEFCPNGGEMEIYLR